MATQQPSRRPAKVSRRALIGYSAGSVGTGGFGTLPGLLLAYYLTDTLGVAAGIAGLIVTVPKLWDVVVGPVVGAMSDADIRRTGTRRALMAVGTAVLPIAFVLTFTAPAAFSSAGAAFWVLGFFLAAATVYSCFQVPYIALPYEITSDYDARTRLMSWRIAVLALAILLFGAGAPAVRDAAGGGFIGYFVMAVVAAAFLAGGMGTAVWGAPGRHDDGPETDPAADPAAADPAVAEATIASGWRNFRDGFGALKTSRPFRLLLITFVLQAFATGIMLAGAQYVAAYTLANEDAVTFLFAALVAPALLVMPIWSAISARLGKKNGFLIASALFTAATLILIALLVAPGPWIYFAVAVAGIGYAGMQMFPLAMLPDTIGDDAASRPARAGAMSGVWTAGETVGLALGPSIFLLTLAAAGFQSSRAGEHVTQSSTALTGIIIGFSVLPAILAAISLAVLARFPAAKRPRQQGKETLSP